jgi:thiol-disulfide isomerase/thioredoxin
MKKFILLTLATITFAGTFFSFTKTSEGGYRLKFSLTGFKDRTTFYLYNSALEEVVDSAILMNGKMVFEGKVATPTVFVVYAESNPAKPMERKSCFFWVENREIELKGDYNGFRFLHVKGSKLNDAEQKMQAVTRKYVVARDSLIEIFFKDQQKNRYVWDIIRKNDQISDSLTFAFIKNNPVTLPTLRALTYQKRNVPKDELRTLMNKIPAELKESDEAIGLRAYLSLNSVPQKGSRFTDIVGKDMSGKEVRLSEIKAKLIFLDFWGSGCGPCRLQNKQLSRIYRKYKSEGLEIVSFSLDKNSANWKKASEKDSLTWINIVDSRGFESPAAVTYDLQAIPASYIINAEGIIVEQFLGFDNEMNLSAKIYELLKTAPTRQ